MADVDDHASELEELHRELALKQRMPEGPPPVGFCLYCGQPQSEAGRRWCDAECRDGWEEENG